ncbi:MAG: type II toxin-antitoxin system RelE/ParE family toxin [Microgenomates group bacterium]
MAWNILYHPRAVKQLKKLHTTDQKKTIDKLRKLAKNFKSKSLSAIPLVGTKSSFRLKIGKIRIIFEKDYKTKTIYVWRIKYRKDIYRP